jgi:hypothetical protein
MHALYMHRYLSWFDRHVVVFDGGDHEALGFQHLLIAAYETFRINIYVST